MRRSSAKKRREDRHRMMVDGVPPSSNPTSSVAWFIISCGCAFGHTHRRRRWIMEIVTDPTSRRSGYLSDVFADQSRVCRSRSPRADSNNRPGPLGSIAAMRHQRLAQSGARPVQPDTKCVAGQSQVGGHGLAILFAEIDAPDQVRRPPDAVRKSARAWQVQSRAICDGASATHSSGSRAAAAASRLRRVPFR